MTESQRVCLLNEEAVERALSRMARELVEKNGGPSNLVLMGIHRRGVQLSALLKSEIEKVAGTEIPSGSLDITFYRDDLMTIGPRPVIGESELPADGIDGRSVVIVDDVLYTGRTARAAMNELMDWGRPARILLCVLVDRGGREVPIQPDVVGKVQEDLPNAHVEVLVPDLDGELGAYLLRNPEKDEGAGQAESEGTQ
ncbi:MAG: bifunctional pyr operon transcriptional regulator/uracil phosphoribosyltransferase PyrR [Gemmatimonadetes bacterium]|nr:bifunctional pyr operon transcriptional regulator/uracil phosphoribosyltransferase PyrR [Gemmatimonadota bacterium]